MVTCSELPRARLPIHTRIYNEYRPTHLPFIAGSALQTRSIYKFHLPIWFLILNSGTTEKKGEKINLIIQVNYCYFPVVFEVYTALRDLQVGRPSGLTCFPR